MRIDSDKLRTDLVNFAIFRLVSGERSDVIGWLRKMSTDEHSMKRRGWFDHVWNAELNWISGLKRRLVTARTLDVARLKLRDCMCVFINLLFRYLTVHKLENMRFQTDLRQLVHDKPQ